MTQEEKKEYSVELLYEKINSINTNENIKYEFEWNLDTGLRFVSDKMLDIIINMLKKYHFKLKMNEDGELCIVNNLISLCVDDISMEKLKDDLENENLSTRESSFKFKNLELYKDYVCVGCKFDRCPKFYAGYILYLKNNGLLLEKLKDREEYRKNELKSDYFTFEWKVDGILKEIPEKTYKFAEEYYNRGFIHVKPSLNNNGDIVINMAHSCSDISLCNYDFSKLQKTSLDYSKWQRIRRNKDEFIKFCNVFTCRLELCPFIVAGYIYYLKRKGLDKKIEEEREYYYKNKEEIDKKHQEEREEKLLKIKNKADDNVKELKEQYSSKIKKINKLIEIINNKKITNMHITIEGNDKIVKSYCEKIINEILKSNANISESETISLQNLAATNMTIYTKYDENTYEKTVFKNIKSNKLYVITNIEEFVKDYKLYFAGNNLGYNEIRKKQFINILENIVDLVANNYIILDGTTNEIDKFIELDSRLKFVFQENRFIVEDISIDEMFEEYQKELKVDLMEELRNNEKKVKKEFIKYVSLNREFIPFSNVEFSKYLSSYANSREKIVFPEDMYKKETVDESLKNIIGMGKVKEKLKNFERYALYMLQAKTLGLKLNKSNLHMIFTGNSGTGKTTIARIMAKMLFDLGLIKENKLIEVERKDLIAGYIGQTAPKTMEVIDKAMGGVLFIDEAYSLTATGNNDFGQEAIATLIKAMEDHKDEFVVIFAGYRDEMKTFKDTNPGISSRIGYTFDFEDYTAEELKEIFYIKMKNMGYKLDKNIDNAIISICDYFTKRKNFGNGRFVDKLIQETIMQHAIRDTNEIELITLEDIPTISDLSNTRESNDISIEEMLSDIIGMDELKQKIKEFCNYVIFLEKAKNEGIMLPNQNMHMIFTGNPGTGKTTIARIISEILFKIGVIHENKLIEVERKDLVAGYIGQTAPKTMEVIEKAMGGVLFIDEAYSLYKNSENDFGQEAIATLINAMEDHKGEFIVIFAGYQKEMGEFLNMNSGIASRIGYVFDFKDYDADEYCQIFYKKIEKTGFELNENAKDNVLKVMKYFCNMENIGNGRFVDKVLQETILKHSRNENAKLKEIEAVDIPTIKEITKLLFDGDSLIDVEKISLEAQKQTAIHEIGHAAVRYLLFKDPQIIKITINAEGKGTLGYVMHKNMRNKYTSSKEDCYNEIKVKLAGMAAEQEFMGFYENGNTSDLKSATEIAKLMVTKYGMSDYGLGQISNYESGPLAEIVQQEINKILKICFDDAIKLIHYNKGKIENAVNYLYQNKEIDEEQFIKSFNDAK